MDMFVCALRGKLSNPPHEASTGLFDHRHLYRVSANAIKTEIRGWRHRSHTGRSAKEHVDTVPAVGSVAGSAAGDRPFLHHGRIKLSDLHVSLT